MIVGIGCRWNRISLSDSGYFNPQPSPILIHSPIPIHSPNSDWILYIFIVVIKHCRKKVLA